jgi:hypothetical protein
LDAVEFAGMVKRGDPLAKVVKWQGLLSGTNDYNGKKTLATDLRPLG